MSRLGLVPGVLLLDVVFALIGYGLLWGALRGRDARTWASYAGVAVLVGAAVSLALMSALSVTGIPMGVPALAVTGGLLAAAGVILGRRLPAGWRDSLMVSRAPAPHPSRLESAVAVSAAFVVVAILVLTIVGGFRSSPNLDDTWSFWLPKGRAVGSVGLDPRFFTPTDGSVPFSNPDYPLWWSLAANLATRFVGRLDLRAVNGHLAIMVVAFVGAVARLLWGYIRPAFLFGGLALLLLSPELIRQAQGGGADIPVAIYLSLFVVVAVRWLATGDRLGLALAVAFAMAAVAIKREGAVQLVAFALVLSVFWVRGRPRRVATLWAGVGGAFLLTVPWFAWQAAHGIKPDIPLSDFFDPGHLASRTERIRPSIDAFTSHLFSPSEWLTVVPLCLALSVVVAYRGRRAVGLAPIVLFGVGFALLVWVLWADPLDLTYRLGTAGRRIVDPIAFIAGVSVPVLAEMLVRIWRRPAAPAAEP